VGETSPHIEVAHNNLEVQEKILICLGKFFKGMENISMLQNQNKITDKLRKMGTGEFGPPFWR